ncbi:MAG: SDR family oxidoreductase [Ignavibacteriaceae bacterium]|nr:SDR family oxidoreductase [Ignavibacteriaceae bacterium]
MKAIVFGASGATGKLVVQQLVKRSVLVRIVMRASAIIPSQFLDDKRIEIVTGNINDFDVQKIKDLVKDCNFVICCLGHNISLKGIYGSPHKLVYNTVAKVIESLQVHKMKPKFILMSTTAYTNKKSGESNTFGEKLLFFLLKYLLPPHKDNVLAADYLVYKLGSQSNINWVAVRPDSLFDEESESCYEIHNYKLRSPIFNAGKTSRLNVSHFMAELLTNDNLWREWEYKTPVIYNKE